MSGILEVVNPGPTVTIQDQGRPGYARYGLSAGGAMDPWALAEGEALLGNEPGTAALEMAGFGGRFRVHEFFAYENTWLFTTSRAGWH